MSNQCPSVKLIVQQLTEVVKSASSSAPTLVSHRSAPIHVNHVSKASFADAVKQFVHDHRLTKDDAFKGFMKNMYASHVCSGSMDIFKIVLDHLLQKNSLPYFSIGDCPLLSPIGMSISTSIPDPTPLKPLLAMSTLLPPKTLQPSMLL